MQVLPARTLKARRFAATAVGGSPLDHLAAVGCCRRSAPAAPSTSPPLPSTKHTPLLAHHIAAAAAESRSSRPISSPGTIHMAARAPPSRRALHHSHADHHRTQMISARSSAAQSDANRFSLWIGAASRLRSAEAMAPARGDHDARAVDVRPLSSTDAPGDRRRSRQLAAHLLESFLRIMQAVRHGIVDILCTPAHSAAGAEPAPRVSRFPARAARRRAWPRHRLREQTVRNGWSALQ